MSKPTPKRKARADAPRPIRSEAILIRLLPAEREEIYAGAARTGVPVSVFMRHTALAALRRSA